ncbi:MAG: SPOR domain-containing protein [Rhodospirillaceae bacterium]|nr:SPOR domain-containing protein [Rhodospirillaceae bacterium]
MEEGPTPPSGPISEPARRRRRLWPTLVVLVAFGGCAGIVAYAYRADLMQTDRQGPVPTIQADSRPIKTRPERPGGMEVPDQDKEIFGRLAPGPSSGPVIERLLPPPELPMPRPPAQAVLVEAPEPPSRPTAPQLPTAAPMPPAAPPAMAALPASGRRIQLSSVRSADDANREWARLVKNHPDVLSGLSLTVSPAELGGDRGTVYRVQAGPVADEAAARDLCGKLSARRQGCLVVRP